jgi:hypothetical protein
MKIAISARNINFLLTMLLSEADFAVGTEGSDLTH